MKYQSQYNKFVLADANAMSIQGLRTDSILLKNHHHNTENYTSTGSGTGGGVNRAMLDTGIYTIITYLIISAIL